MLTLVKVIHLVLYNMAIWYLNMIEENKSAVGMKVFQYIIINFGVMVMVVKQMLVEVETRGVFDSMKIICG